MATGDIHLPQARKLDSDEMSPFGGVLEKALRNYSELTKAQYLPKEKEQNLQQQIAKTLMDQASAKHAEPMALAKLQHEQAMAPYLGAQTNKLNTMTPLEAEKLRIDNRFAPEMNRADIDFKKVNTDRVRQLTPLEAMKQKILNAHLDDREKAEIGEIGAKTKYYEQGGSKSAAGNQYEVAYQNNVAKDNPDLTPDQVYEAANVLAQGGTQLADGTPLKELSPTARRSLDKAMKNGTTSAITTNAVMARKAEAELEVFQKMTAPLLAPYGDTIFNFSPKQIADSFSDKPEDQDRLGKFIAASAAQYEASQIRIKLAGGEPGASATEQLLEHSKQLINTKLPKVSARARATAAIELDKILKAGLKARESVGYGLSGSGNKEMASPTGNNKAQVTEENIVHTMKETGLTRDQVMSKLKERGLI